MAVHDRYARLTPFELAFAGEEFGEARFQAIREELEARGPEAPDLEAFLALPSVAQALGDLMEPDAGPAALHEYGALLYHAFRFWRHGRPLFLLETQVARFLVETEPALAGWETELPSPAGYVQLPQHLFWARVLDEGPAESLDGFFWSVADDGRIAALLVLGLRADRPGVSAVPLDALRPEELRELAELPARERGRDFESTLPGGEIERLYSLETAGEAIKLVTRALWYLERYAGAHEREEPAEARPGDPVPSRLPYYRVGASGRY